MITAFTVLLFRLFTFYVPLLIRCYAFVRGVLRPFISLFTPLRCLCSLLMQFDYRCYLLRFDDLRCPRFLTTTAPAFPVVRSLLRYPHTAVDPTLHLLQISVLCWWYVYPDFYIRCSFDSHCIVPHHSDHCSRWCWRTFRCWFRCCCWPSHSRSRWRADWTFIYIYRWLRLLLIFPLPVPISVATALTPLHYDCVTFPHTLTLWHFYGVDIWNGDW